MKKNIKSKSSTKRAIQKIKTLGVQRRASREAKATAQVEIRRLADLKPHPLAALIFGRMPPGMLDDLTKDSPEYVVPNPASCDPELVRIEVLSDGQIVHGFVFAEVHAASGDRNVPVLVRHDLDELGEAAIAARIMEEPPYKLDHAPIEKFRCDLVRHGHLDELESLKRGEFLDCPVVEKIAQSIGVHPAVVSIMFRAHCAPTEFIEYMERDLLSPKVVCELIKEEDAPLAEVLDILDYKEDQKCAIHRSSSRQEMDARVKAVLAHHKGRAGECCEQEQMMLMPKKSSCTWPRYLWQ